MFDLGAVVTGLKLPTKTIVAVCIATAILIFSDEITLRKLGLDDFVSSNRTYFGVAFVISLCLASTSFVFAISTIVRSWFNETIWIRQHKKRLHRLSPDEKEILMHYIGNQVRSQILPMQDGTVNGLVAEKIIFRSSNLGSINGFAYNIQPWAWDYLNEHPDLLG